MSKYECKRLFKAEFRTMLNSMDAHTINSAWTDFIENLFNAGSINYKVYAKCHGIKIA